jgi:hypothetical protein
MPMAGAGIGVAKAQPACRVFNETGQALCGKFLHFWEGNGGLAQHGYPLTGQVYEVSFGKSHTVQYFERSVFEEVESTGGVIVLPLGALRYQEKYPKDPPRPLDGPVAGTGTADQQAVRAAFSEYWKSHGGLLWQGYPVTGPIIEVSELDGKEYAMQYFDKAVLEYHPENPPPYNVLLSHLGRFKFVSSPNAQGEPLIGEWGSPGIRFVAGQSGGRIDVYCDFYIEFGQAIIVRSGRFEEAAEYSRRWKIRPSPGDWMQGQLSGTVQEDMLTFTMTLVSEVTLGPYTVYRGRTEPPGDCSR